VKPIRLEDEASAEVSDAARWYERRQQGLGRRYLEALDSTFRQIAQMPQAGSPMPDVSPMLGVRRAPVKSFPYAVVYVETDNAIRILALAHERRRPGYWFPRL
jgi:plasmid stabilization system protein ParE